MNGFVKIGKTLVSLRDLKLAQPFGDETVKVVLHNGGCNTSGGDLTYLIHAPDFDAQKIIDGLNGL